jgi:hypothetical protein
VTPIPAPTTGVADNAQIAGLVPVVQSPLFWDPLQKAEVEPSDSPVISLDPPVRGA